MTFLEDHQSELGLEASRLVKEWNLVDESAMIKRRDFALVFLPLETPILPHKSRRVFRLAVLNKKWEIALKYFGETKYKDLITLFRGLSESITKCDKRSLLIRKVLDRYPRFGKDEAKFIVNDEYLVNCFYSAINHFGPLLYKWVSSGIFDTYVYSLLFAHKCPADSESLIEPIRKGSRGVVLGLLRLGAVPTKEIQDMARRHYRQLILLTNDQINNLFAEYGVDPKMGKWNYPKGSVDYSISDWLGLLNDFDRLWDLSDGDYYDRFSPCMHRIKRVEPLSAMNMLQKSRIDYRT